MSFIHISLLFLYQTTKYFTPIYNQSILDDMKNIECHLMNDDDTAKIEALGLGDSCAFL